MNKSRVLVLSSWIIVPAVLFFLGRSLQKEESSSEASRGKRSSSVQRSSAQGGLVHDELYGHLRNLKNSSGFESFFRGSFTDENQPMEEDQVRHDSLLAIADAWAAKAPEEAVQFLNELAIPDLRNPYLFFALGQWGRQNPESALAWLKKHYPDADDVSRMYLTAGVIRGMVHSQPEVAFNELLAMTPGPERRGAVDFLLQTWAQEGGEKMGQYLDQIPENNVRLREAALRKGIQFLPTEEFTVMSDWASQLSNEKDRMTTQTAIAAFWAQRDSQEAMDWAGSLPKDDFGIRSEAMARAVTYWAREEPEKAFEWASKHHGDPDYDRALRSVAWNTVGYQHEQAFEQIAQITDPVARDRTFDQIGWMWMSDAPAAARDFFETTTLVPDEIRYQILSNFY